MAANPPSLSPAKDKTTMCPFSSWNLEHLTAFRSKVSDGMKKAMLLIGYPSFFSWLKWEQYFLGDFYTPSEVTVLESNVI